VIKRKTTEELVAERPTPEKIKTLPRTPMVVIADNIRSLDNVGLLFRLCETARIEKLYLTGYTGYPRTANDTRPEPVIARHEHRIAKTAVYALPYQPWEYVEDPLPLATRLKQEGRQVVSLEQTEQSVPYHTATYQLPVALVIGHERQGVREDLLNLSDTVIDIPILGLGNSHNVATATGIVMYTILKETGQLNNF
jgi:tRNA G18 (ribose-2'-O)-methylase SpoU